MEGKLSVKRIGVFLLAACLFGGNVKAHADESSPWLFEAGGAIVGYTLTLGATFAIFWGASSDFGRKSPSNTGYGFFVNLVDVTSPGWNLGLAMMVTPLYAPVLVGNFAALGAWIAGRECDAGWAIGASYIGEAVAGLAGYGIGLLVSPANSFGYALIGAGAGMLIGGFLGAFWSTKPSHLQPAFLDSKDGKLTYGLSLPEIRFGKDFALDYLHAQIATIRF